jgi:hypothetical protein
LAGKVVRFTVFTRTRDSSTADRYRLLPFATVAEPALAPYLLAKVAVFPISLVKRELAGLKSLPPRHAVWTAENQALDSSEFLENSSNSASFDLKPHRRKCRRDRHAGLMPGFSLPQSFVVRFRVSDPAK